MAKISSNTHGEQQSERTRAHTHEPRCRFASKLHAARVLHVPAMLINVCLIHKLRQDALTPVEGKGVGVSLLPFISNSDHMCYLYGDLQV